MVTYWIYSLALLYFVILVHATDPVEVCNLNDLECLGDFIISTTASFSTASSSSFGEPLSTVSAAGTAEVLSDFHEAKLVKPKPNPNNPDGREKLPTKDDGTVQDKYNQDRDIDSGSSGLGDSVDESTATGLSKVEAGVLSACGILVVAGVAVGIFVWKNATRRRNFRNQDMSMTDLEYNHGSDDSGGYPMAVKNSISQISKATKEPSITSQQQKGDIQSVKSTTTVNSKNRAMIQKQLQQEAEQEERVQLQHLRQQPTIKLILPAFERDEDDFYASWEQPSFQNEQIQQIPDQQAAIFQLPIRKSRAVGIVYDESQVADIIQPNSIAADNVDTYNTPEVGKEYEMANVSPGLQANTVSRPSVLDPAHDPTAITYTLQKFLNSPAQSFKSPVQIPVNLGDNDQGDDQDDTIDDSLDDKQDAYGVGYNTAKTVGPSVQNLGQQLNKIFRRQPHQFRATNSVPLPMPTTMVDIDLHEQTSSKANHTAAQIKRETEHGKQPFLSPLDLPDDRYIPLRGAAGPPLVSRAEVLADPIRRLGEDEIALWEQKCRKEELKRLSYKMWDEQLPREENEEHDRNPPIACYYGQEEKDNR